jgi:hypothetical protein
MWRDPSSPNPTIDRALVHLPMKLGGLRLLSFSDPSPHVFEAASAAAEHVLSAFVDAPHCDDNRTSQRERCWTLFNEQRSALFELVSPGERAKVVENSSALGRRWLTTIPSTPNRLISGAELAITLQNRTLLAIHTSTCLACGEANPTTSHIDACLKTSGIRTKRHEVLKPALGVALKSAPGSRVDYEPLILQDHTTQPARVRRNDVRFSGSVEADHSPMEFDATVPLILTRTEPHCV